MCLPSLLIRPQALVTVLVRMRCLASPMVSVKAFDTLPPHSEAFDHCAMTAAVAAPADRDVDAEREFEAAFYYSRPPSPRCGHGERFTWRVHSEP